MKFAFANSNPRAFARAFILLAFFALPLSADAASDLLARKSFTFTAAEPDPVVDRTVSDLRSVFRRYVPAFDSSTKVVRPLEVAGSATHPTINMVAKKCVLFICKEVELDATISIREVNGACRRNYVLSADLMRSSAMLTDNYSSLTVNICYSANDGDGKFQVDAFADRAPKYDAGAVSKEILKMLTLQIEPMTTALHKTLLANGARRIGPRE